MTRQEWREVHRWRRQTQKRFAEREQDLMINQPKFVGPDTVVLSPPLGSVGEYMKYLADHREDYKRFFGVE